MGIQALIFLQKEWSTQGAVVLFAFTQSYSLYTFHFALPHRCIPCASSARMSPTRSSWVWVTTHGPPSPSCSAASEPTSTSASRAGTAPTTAPSDRSIEVWSYYLALREKEKIQSSCLVKMNLSSHTISSCFTNTWVLQINLRVMNHHLFMVKSEYPDEDLKGA